MIAILLLFAGFADVPKYVTVPAFETKAYKATAKPAAPVPGLHSHRCGHCGHVWSHGSDSFGKVADHTCPKCGSGPYWQPINDPWRGTLPMYRPTPRGQAFCPS